jgi:hypothetical protein
MFVRCAGAKDIHGKDMDGVEIKCSVRRNIGRQIRLADDLAFLSTTGRACGKFEGIEIKCAAILPLKAE